MRALAVAPVVAVLATGMAMPAQAATETDYFTFLHASSSYGISAHTDGYGRARETTVLPSG